MTCLFQFPFDPLTLYVNGEQANQTVLNRPHEEMLANIQSLRDAVCTALGLQVIANDPEDNRVKVLPGVYINSTGTRVLQLAVEQQSPVFAPVTAPGQFRYDLVQIDDSKVVQIKQGAEVVGAADPFDEHPDIDSDRMTLAIVEVSEDGAVVISQSEITDTREHLNKGGGGGGAALVIQEFTVDAALAQQLFNIIGFTYRQGQNELFVFSGGQYMTVDEDYTETSNSSITFLSGRKLGEKVTIKRIASAGSTGASFYQLILATSLGQTTFNLAGSYELGNNSMQVYRNGKRLTNGPGYTESSSTSIEYGDTDAVIDDEFVFWVPPAGGGDGAGASIAHREEQTAAAGQTLVTWLDITYTPGSEGLVLFRNGIEQSLGTHYTETSPTSVTFIVGLGVGNRIEGIAHSE